MKLPVHLAERHRTLLLLLVGPVLLGAAVLLGVWWFLPPAHPTSAPTTGGLGQLAAPSPGLLVQVSGAVLHPGLYHVPPGTRGYTVVQLAGGLSTDADADKLPNLAVVLKDGAIIKVPRLSATSRSGAAAKLSLNTATAGQLATIPGFTAQLAQAAVLYRTDAGGFTSLTQLESVLGMDPAAYAKAKSHLTL
ncbi:MAG: helix-hairpin-helix domain-containing protein [Candidatus Dormiibacterota bacterium]